MKPLISIVIPAAPGRIERLKCILSRCSLNMVRHPERTFEIIVVDGSNHGEYRALCEYAAGIYPLKYIHLPIGRFINAGYPRNVGFRFAEGAIFTQIDIDWYIGEDFIEGMLEPYEKGFMVINNGYMIDTSESRKANTCPGYIEALNAILLDQENGMEKEILSIFKACEIPGPERPKSIWLWAAPRGNFLHINAYDEIYCRKWAYTREDDDLFWRLVCSGLPRYGDSFKKFCGLHLWHPAAQRNNELNQLNKDYYSSLIKKSSEGIIVEELVRNVGREWGKMTKDSYIIIDEKVLDFKAAEEWIAKNNLDITPYQSPWDTIEAMVESLEK